MANNRRCEGLIALWDSGNKPLYWNNGADERMAGTGLVERGGQRQSVSYRTPLGLEELA